MASNRSPRSGMILASPIAANSGLFHKALCIASLTGMFCLAIPGTAMAGRIPDAPQELMFMYLQSLNLTQADGGILTDWAKHSMPYRFVDDATNNEVKLDALHKKALATIHDHVAARRVVLGIPVRFGDYDVVKHTMRVVYPVYWQHPVITNSVGWLKAVLHARSMRPQKELGRPSYSEDVACTYAPGGEDFSRTVGNGFADISQSRHFDVIAACDQNTHNQYSSGMFIHPSLLPDIFRLNLDEPPDWNEVDMEPGKASAVIDGLAHSLNREAWADIVLDIESMDTKNVGSPRDDEGGPPDKNLTVGAVFTVKPIAIFYWLANWTNTKQPDSFIMALGNVHLSHPPPGGVIDSSMIIAPLPQNSATIVAAQALTGATQPGQVSQRVGNEVLPGPVAETPTIPQSNGPSIDFGKPGIQDDK